MPLFGRKSDPIVIDQTSAKAWKADPGAVRWSSALKSEAAGAKSMEKSYQDRPPTAMEVGAAAAAGARWVAEEAEGLYDGRGNRGRRSVQFDGHGRGKVPLFFLGGIWSARRGNPVDGRQDYGRWPETTMPRRGTPTQHNYGPPVVHQVIDTRGSGRAGRDGCPGCPQC